MYSGLIVGKVGIRVTVLLRHNIESSTAFSNVIPDVAGCVIVCTVTSPQGTATGGVL